MPGECASAGCIKESVSQRGVQLLIGRLVTDGAFRRRVERGGSRYLAGLRGSGIDLSRTEIAALIEMDPRVWSNVAKQIDLAWSRRSAVEADPPRRYRDLTVQQQRVLTGVCDGLRNQDIAALIGISESAVKATLQQLFRKLSVRRRVQLVRLALGKAVALLCLAVLIGFTAVAPVSAQTSLSWPEVRARLEASNPTLQADQLVVDESRAAEITAFLRPNPQCGVTLDQIGHTISTPDNPTNIFSASTLVGNCSYLHERRHKRELRRDTARDATTVAMSSHMNLDRTLMFALRSAFVQVLEAKAALALARDNLAFYDQVLTISRSRFDAGDIAQIDLNRLQLQRVQLESAVETADVNLRTAKIQLLALLNDRTPIDQFDVAGTFDFGEGVPALADLDRQAIDTRPDLRAAVQSVDQATVAHRLAIANGSTDPIFSVDSGFPAISQAYQSYAPPLREYVGGNVTIPLRIFDRNQGEKLRTELDITRNQRLVDAARAQVFSDVDSAYATLVSTINLLRPYKDHYLAQSTQVRDIVTQSYQRGGAALLDFLQAEQDYRAVQLNYITLVGSYLTAAAQLNEAVGQEVIP